jgi:phosphatidylethanolamine/phosphatidyl-N-methylethanolamine N-methyltransferase
MKSDSAAIKKRYDRIAPYFEGLEAVMEGLFFKNWRKKLWAKVDGYHILEVGVGTGKNFDYYPADARITAIDFSQEMLKQATHKKDRKNISVELDLMDVQSLSFADNSFDTVIGSFVFCSVPLPLKGLKELYRVCKPGGQVLLLEHVVSSKPLIARVMNFINPVIVALVGANINRNTIKNVKACCFTSVRVDEHSSDIIKLIEARK